MSVISNGFVAPRAVSAKAQAEAAARKTHRRYGNNHIGVSLELQRRIRIGEGSDGHSPLLGAAKYIPLFYLRRRRSAGKAASPRSPRDVGSGTSGASIEISSTYHSAPGCPLKTKPLIPAPTNSGKFQACDALVTPSILRVKV